MVNGLTMPTQLSEPFIGFDDNNFVFLFMYLLLAIPLCECLIKQIHDGVIHPSMALFVISQVAMFCDESGAIRREMIVSFVIMSIALSFDRLFHFVKHRISLQFYQFLVIVIIGPLIEEIGREFSHFAGMGFVLIEYSCTSGERLRPMIRIGFHYGLRNYSLYYRFVFHAVWNLYSVFTKHHLGVLPASLYSELRKLPGWSEEKRAALMSEIRSVSARARDGYDIVKAKCLNLPAWGVEMNYRYNSWRYNLPPLDLTYVKRLLVSARTAGMRYMTDEILRYFGPIRGVSVVGIERTVLFFLSLCQQHSVSGLVTVTLQYASASSQRSLSELFMDFIRKVPTYTGFKPESYKEVSSQLDWILDSASSFLNSRAHKWLRTVVTGCLCIPLFHNLGIEFDAKNLGLFDQDTSRLYGKDKVSFAVTVAKALKNCVHNGIKASLGELDIDIFKGDGLYGSFMTDASSLKEQEPYVRPGPSEGTWINTREYRTKLTSTIVKGRAVVQEIRAHPDVDSQQRAYINANLKDLEKIEAKMLVKDMAAHKHPAFILICVGAPGVGKTVVMNHFHQTMEKAKGRGYSAEAVANLMPDVEFQDNITNGTRIIHLDEIGIEKPQGGRLETKNSTVRMLLNYGDSNPQVVNKSDVTEKGKTYNLNDYVTGSTNSFNINAQYVTKFPEAIYRRINWVEVKVEESYTLPGTNRVDTDRLKEEGLSMTSKFLLREVIFPTTGGQFVMGADGSPVMKQYGDWVSLPEYLILLEERIKAHDNACALGASVTTSWEESSCPHGRSYEVCLDCIHPERVAALRESVTRNVAFVSTEAYDEAKESSPSPVPQDRDEVDSLSELMAKSYEISDDESERIAVCAFTGEPVKLEEIDLKTEGEQEEEKDESDEDSDLDDNLNIFGEQADALRRLIRHPVKRDWRKVAEAIFNALLGICMSLFAFFSPVLLWLISRSLLVLFTWIYTYRSTRYISDMCDTALWTGKTCLSEAYIILSSQVRGYETDQDRFERRMRKSKLTEKERHLMWYFDILLKILMSSAATALIISFFNLMQSKLRPEGVAESKPPAEKISPKEFARRLEELGVDLERLTPDGGHNNRWTAPPMMSVQAAEKSNLPTDHLLKKVQRQVWNLTAYDQGGMAMKAHAVAIAPEIIVVNSHVVKGVKSLKLERIVCSTDEDPSLVNKLVYNNLDSKDIVSISSDVTVIYTAGLTAKNLLDYIPNAPESHSLWWSTKIAATQVFPKGPLATTSTFSRPLPLGDDAGTILENPIIYTNPSHADGMCGVPLVQDKGNVTVLVGIHAGGSSTASDAQCAATSFFRPELEGAINSLRQNRRLMPLAAEGSIFPFTIEGKEAIIGLPDSRSFLNWQKGNIGFEGTVKNLTYHRPKPKMSFLPTAPFADRLGVPTRDTEGRYLWGVPDFSEHPSEKEDIGYYSPYHKWASKAFQSSPVMHITRVESAVDELWRKYSSANIDWETKPLDILSVCAGDNLVQALHKMNAKASMGFGFKGKKHEFMDQISTEQAPDGKILNDEVLGHVLEVINIYAAGETARPVSKASLKVEARPRQEGGDIKPPRVFCATPISDVVIGRMFLLPLTNLLRQDVSTFECCVGISATSHDWGKIRQGFAKLGVLDSVFGADISGFDTRMLLSVKHGASTIIMRMAAKAGYSERAQTILRAYLTDRLWPLIMVKNDIIECKSVQVSGQVATAEFNSICLSIIYRMVYDLLKEKFAPQENFNENVALAVYGDDSKAGSKSPWFTQETFCRGCLFYGIKATTASKSLDYVDFVPFNGEEFLHRTWRWDDEYKAWCAPLALDSMARSLVLNNTSQIGVQMQAFESARSINYELAQHGREVFEEKMIALKSILKDAELDQYLTQSPFKSYDEIMESCYGPRE